MKNYNLTGQERKALVEKIAELTGEKAVYLGMPTAGFRVGKYTISRTGELTWEDGTDADELIAGLKEAGFIAEGDKTADPEPTEELADDTAAENADDETTISISLPDDLTDEQFYILRQIVKGKETLIRHTFQTETAEIIRKDGQIQFPWFTASDGDHTFAYIAFLTRLVKLAKELKRASGKDMEPENEKYAFRCFLLRLGFIGAEYKGVRKILLENLNGNSAFKSGHKKSDSEAATV